jgi:hypothetical protein
VPDLDLIRGEGIGEGGSSVGCMGGYCLAASAGPIDVRLYVEGELLLLLSGLNPCGVKPSVDDVNSACIDIRRLLILLIELYRRLDVSSVSKVLLKIEIPSYAAAALTMLTHLYSSHHRHHVLIPNISQHAAGEVHKLPFAYYV